MAREIAGETFMPYGYDGDTSCIKTYGRTCLLLDYLVGDDSRWDKTARKFVNYKDTYAERPGGLHLPTAACLRESEMRILAWYRINEAELNEYFETTDWHYITDDQCEAAIHFEAISEILKSTGWKEEIDFDLEQYRFRHEKDEDYE
jgi:hypothetical protein